MNVEQAELRIRTQHTNPMRERGTARPRLSRARASLTRRVSVSDSRRGTSLLEIIVAVLLLGAVMTVSVRLLGWAAATRESADRRQWAVQEVANLMEHFAARPWSELTAEAAAAVSISDATRATLREAELKIEVTDAAGEPAAKRVAIELRWRNRAGEFDSPVRLTSWIYRPTEVKP